MNENLTLVSNKSQPNELLMLLLENRGRYISGEKISKDFGISRTAVWKQINTLREWGYKIKSSSRLGYCIEESPDLLLPEEIWSSCDLSILGSEIYYYSLIDSTNNAAKKIAQEGAPEGTLVIAERQNKGRGRIERQWQSPLGGIWLSVILRPHLLPQDAPKLTIMTAVAVAEAIRSEIEIEADIKWPNDILIHGKKVCGILTEMSAELDAVNYVVIGVGINANNDSFSEELKDIAVSLKEVKGQKINRLNLLCAVLSKLEDYYEKAETEGFYEILERWKSLCVNLGKKVNIKSINGSFEGTAVDIDEFGALLVKKQDGDIARVLSGDVSLRQNED